MADESHDPELLDEIAVRLGDFNQRMGVEPLPISGGPDARFTRFEPQLGFMEHWASALRARWSIKLFKRTDGHTVIMYQYVMAFPDSPATDRVETEAKIWFFLRKSGDDYQPILQEEVTDASPLLIRFDTQGGISVMDDGLVFHPYVWNGHKLVRK